MNPVILYYQLCFTLSLLLTLVYTYQWRRTAGSNFMLLFAMIPVANMGYLFQALATNLEEALLATKVNYIGGCFFQLFMLLGSIYLCHFSMSPAFKTFLFALSAFVYIHVCMAGWSDSFYRSISFSIEDGVAVLTKEYGPMHTVFYIVILGYVIANFAILLYSAKYKPEVSVKNLWLLFFLNFTTVTVFFLGREISRTVETVAAAYVVVQFVCLLIINDLRLYNITAGVAETLLEQGSDALITFDLRGNYLVSNATAKVLIPELKMARTDEPLHTDEPALATLNEWVEKFKENEIFSVHSFDREDKNYELQLNYLEENGKHLGICMVINDVTKEKRYIDLINNYNANLQTEVEKKTSRIMRMQENLILSMATMVESRDNSTGGHSFRTSEVVQIIVEKMLEAGDPRATAGFATIMKKAAALHDLGKIGVDDEVLRKPGKFTPEEYEKMKKHAAFGADIVGRVLEDSADEDFRRIAVNVAHYHHERMDGSGYPEGLKGEKIPIEARLMAIADVYDALVSKRCYKEAMSFEEAFNIIEEGMGTQFDASLNPYFVAAREDLENYYAVVNAVL